MLKEIDCPQIFKLKIKEYKKSNRKEFILLLLNNRKRFNYAIESMQLGYHIFSIKHIGYRFYIKATFAHEQTISSQLKLPGLWYLRNSRSPTPFSRLKYLEICSMSVKSKSEVILDIDKLVSISSFEIKPMRTN